MPRRNQNPDGSDPKKNSKERALTPKQISIWNHIQIHLFQTSIS